METMLVAVFDSGLKARNASHALDALNEADTIRLNASAIVTKSSGGAISVVKSHRPTPEGTLGGTALGTFIGMLTGGVGLAIGAATGLVLGAATDVFDKKVEREFLATVENALEPGDSAVVAQIYEEEPGPVNERMAALSGVVIRRPLTEVADEEYEKQAAAVKRRLPGR